MMTGDKNWVFDPKIKVKRLHPVLETKKGTNVMMSGKTLDVKTGCS
jgi:hypothetical protein